MPVTGGTGTGATFQITFNTSGQVQGLALVGPGTGYSNGDTLTPVANSGIPTANAPSGIGSLTGFTITVTAPNTLLAGNGLPFTSNVMNAIPSIGATISVNTDDNGTIKTFTYGTGANPIPYPGTASIIDAELDASYTLNNDPAVSAVMTNAIGASSFPATWKTLTSITTPPSNGNTFTFGYDGSTWTWVTSGATGNQINIPGTNTLTNAINAAQAALAAAYSALTVTSVTTGSTGVSWTASVTANKNVWSPAIPATAAPDLP
mgnify:FL=1